MHPAPLEWCHRRPSGEPRLSSLPTSNKTTTMYRSVSRDHVGSQSSHPLPAVPRSSPTQLWYQQKPNGKHGLLLPHGSNKVVPSSTSLLYWCQRIPAKNEYPDSHIIIQNVQVPTENCLSYQEP